MQKWCRASVAHADAWLAMQHVQDIHPKDYTKLALWSDSLMKPGPELPELFSPCPSSSGPGAPPVPGI